MTKTFAAQLKDFADLTKQNMKYVATQSIQDVLRAAQTTQPGVRQTGGSFEVGKIPVETSELVNSLTSEGVTGPESYVTAIANMEIGDVLEFAWTAPYAHRIEAGFSGEDSLGRKYEVPGRFFVSTNAGKFSEFVAAREAEVRE